jgi:hypothetical protein
VAYTNIIYDHVIDGVYDLMATEFPGTQIRFDKNVGNSFLILIESDDFSSLLANGQVRDYGLQIIYEQKVGAYSKHTLKEVTNVIERVKELFKDNTLNWEAVNKNWEDVVDTWGRMLTVEKSTYYSDMMLTENWEAVNKNWEDVVDTWGGEIQRWIDGRITSVEYEQDGDILRASLNFQCTVMEVT